MNNSLKDVVVRNRLITVLEQQIALCGTDDEHDRTTVYLTADDARRIVSWLKEQIPVMRPADKAFTLYNCWK